VQAGHEVALVLTQPDRPAGRGMQLQASPVKQYAISVGLPVEQPANLRALEQQALLRAVQADVMVVAAYGLLLPQVVLDIPRFGCLNIHASLLPRWRGAAPIHRAIEAGDRETGITIMQMEAGLDTGPMLSKSALEIAPDETTGQLHDRLASLGAQLILPVLSTLQSQGPPGLLPQPQPQAKDAPGVSYAHKIDKAQSAVRWADDAAQIGRRLRAFDPFPGMVCQWQGQPLKLWAGQALESIGSSPSAEPGTVVQLDATGLVVQCGAGLLRVTQVQKPGARRQPIAQAYASLQQLQLQVGSVLSGA
jgi:methionyl-tRNA formyltransferase